MKIINHIFPDNENSFSYVRHFEYINKNNLIFPSIYNN